MGGWGSARSQDQCHWGGSRELAGVRAGAVGEGAGRREYREAARVGAGAMEGTPGEGWGRQQGQGPSHLSELGIVDEVRPVAVDQGAQGQPILPAAPHPGGRRRRRRSRVILGYAPGQLQALCWGLALHAHPSPALCSLLRPSCPWAPSLQPALLELLSPGRGAEPQPTRLTKAAG